MTEHRERGLQPGSQLVVHHRGLVVADPADGESRPGQPMTEAHVLRWYEAGMPLLAVAIARLVEEEKLSLDDRVADYVDDSGNGKEAATVRHLLTHMAGFSDAELSDRNVSHDEAIEQIAAYRAEHPAGVRAGFHGSSAWRILAEVAQKTSGRSLERLLHKTVWKPCRIPGAALAVDRRDVARLGDLLGPVHWSGYDVVETVDNGNSGRVPYRVDVIHNSEWHLPKGDPGMGWHGSAPGPPSVL
ncbi:MAG: CubicO group peptidase (beta-lactamase class C family) [Candidatus Poriferisodalaceae bacterium]|jgi:CubicO group peptidase (beta-lactamase class C family)